MFSTQHLTEAVEQAFSIRLDALAKLVAKDPVTALLKVLVWIRDVDVELLGLYQKRQAVSTSSRRRRRDEGSARARSKSIEVLDRSIARTQRSLTK